MPKPLKVLMAEDDPLDAELFQRELRRAGFAPEIRRVDTEEAFVEGLQGEVDLVVADHVLPEFGSRRALELLKASGRNLPLIVVSGKIGEDKAVEAIRLGATDYLLKGQFARLGHAVERALEGARLREERRRDAEALRESERFARAALDALTTQIAIVDEGGTIVAVNEAWRSFAVQNGPVFANVSEGANYLSVCDRTEGPEAGVAQSVARAIRDILEGGRTRFEVEHPCPRPGEDRWFVARITPFPDNGARRVVVAHEDITESRRLEEQLRQSQKMEAIGTLAGGVAHDFNNILAAIMLHLDLLKLDASMPASMQKSLDELSQAARRAAGLTRKLLLFSRQEPARRQRVDLKAVVRGLLAMLDRMVGENYTLDLTGSPEPLWLEGDPGMLELVAMNLVINARDAMPRGGRIELRLDGCELDEGATEAHTAGRAGRFARLIVSDTGCGMNEATRQRVFEPFFTTKAAGKGTGLGLSTVFGIVEQHAGWIEVESVEGRGSTFIVYLPAASGTVGDPEPPEASAAAGRSSRGTLLIVDDNRSMRSAAAGILRMEGYRVLEAGDGLEARNILAARTAPIDLLLTDVVMPGGVLGHELAAEVGNRDRRVKVILMSGHHSSEERAVMAGAFGVCLAKPFSADELLRTVRTALSERPASS
jgi:signal transduction histidine kinase